MTYDQLRAIIGTMTSEQLNQDVTVYVSGEDEYYPLVQDYPICVADGCAEDRLDPGHPYLAI